MKIFEVITLSELGGAQSVLVSLSNLLAENNEVHVISSPGGRMWENLSANIIFHKIGSLQRAINLFKEVKVLFRLRSLYIEHKPDIIHLHSSKIGLLGRLIFPKAKVIYTVHGFASIQIAFRKFLPLEKLLQRRAAYIIGVSEHDVRSMRSENITHNVFCIYNGFKKQDVSLDDEGKKLLKSIRHLKEDGYKIILTIARLSPPKNFKLFNEIASKLIREKYKFIWVGNSFIPEGNVSGNIIFGGEINNASVLNQVADLFILASDYEGLPMSIIEAQSYGVPVIASNVGGISEILVGSNGFAVDNTAEKFVDKINHIFKIEIYRDAQNAALKRFEENFTVGIMYNAYLDIFNNIEKNINN